MTTHLNSIYFKTIGLTLGLALLLACDFGASNSGKPIFEFNERYLSPDTAYEAIFEKLHEELKHGIGIDYYEIHIMPAGEQPKRHFDCGDHLAFYSVAPEKINRPTIKWIGDRDLEVQLPRGLRPLKNATRIEGVSITYVNPY